MTYIPIIKVISVKGEIPIQSQLSHHLQINLNSYLQGLAMVSSLYTCPLGQICANPYHLYADDQQIYLSFKPGPTGVQSAQDDCILQIERCIKEIKNWIAMNMLKINDDKTEFIIFGTHQQLKKIDHITIRIGSENIVPMEHVRNLGFFMDKLYKNTMHMNKLSSSLCHQFKNIQNIRGKLDFEAAKTVVQDLILSKLDYCNSLLVGTPVLSILTSTYSESALQGGV